jgi:hypothetical protein
LLASTSGARGAETGDANTTTNERKKSNETGEDHHMMRTFAVIICSECLYLEFPGCDVHGVLYTERVSPNPSMPEKTNTLTSSSSSSGRLYSAISTLAALTTSTRNSATSSTTTICPSATISTGSCSDGREKVHAKCPKCTAATNNVRPFRDGCRRCKGSTTVYMWSSTIQEVTQAYEAFPPHKEEIEHTALICECCQSVVFPRSREVLTRRTAQHAIVSFSGNSSSASSSSSSASSKPLKVSNFQLSMPHVIGCPRKGMPLQTIAVQLPKSELKFVQERIDQCPLTHKIEGGPQYRPRRVQIVNSQNPLHQIYLHLVSVIIKSFDTTSPNALEPLRNVLNLFDKMKPLSLFEDWAPPRVFAETQVKPNKATCSSCFDSTKYGPEKVFQTRESNDECYWRSSTFETSSHESISPSKEEDINPTGNIIEKEEWICFQFENPVMLSGILLKWHSDHIPLTRFHVSVSMDDINYDTVAIVMVKESSQRKEHRLSFARNTPITHLKVTFPNVCLQISKSMKTTSKSIGLESITCYQSGVIGKVGSEPSATRAEDLLESFQLWLSDAFFKNSCEQVRDVAFETLHRLVLASGSLCAMLQFAKDLLLIQTQTETQKSDLDVLSEKSQKSAQKFLLDVATCFRQLMMSKEEQQLQQQQQHQQSQATSADTKATTNDYSSSQQHQQQQQDKNSIIQQISMSLQDEVTRKSIQSLSSAVGLSWPNETAPTPASTSVASNHSVLPPIWKTMLLASTTPSAITSEGNPASATSSGTICPLASFSGIYPEIFTLVKRRSQVGLMLLYMLSEITAWQMKRMQKAEEYVGKKEEELLFQLEEPFSIEVRPKFFDLSHQLLVQVLSKWLHPSTTVANNSNTLYDQIEASCWDMEMQIVEEHSSSSSQQPLQIFSPNTACVALLQVITCNIRRLVLSSVDPAEIGILPSSIALEASSYSSSGPAALEPMVSSLEQLIGLGAKRSDPFFSISLQAAAAVEVGMEAFYPSFEQRTQLLTSRMGKGSTLEIQVRWPVQEKDQEDPRYERLMLMLQLECIKRGMQHALRGAWHSFMHLIIQVPPSLETAQVLKETFACCIQQAGFSSWQVVAGAQELSINLQRHLHWNRKEKMLQESGAGWIRVYPSDVATFDEVLLDVDHFVHTNSDQKLYSKIINI